MRFNSQNTPQAKEAAERFIGICTRAGSVPPTKADVTIGLLAADGANGNYPIEWEELLAASDADFIHDVGGILEHMDRDSGELIAGFVPRYATHYEGFAAFHEFEDSRVAQMAGEAVGPDAEPS
ncbi:hypothetical protein [Halofilum ochraceum]|uniref:DUF6874 family protein n=1 Tax=Halofilum ochraceum TaxID=1611323 RepID=UPI0008DAEAB0|nr:hypothetical protein [Halofilum ochraceum]